MAYSKVLRGRLLRCALQPSLGFSVDRQSTKASTETERVDGVGFRLRPRKQREDQGELRAADAPTARPRPTLGARVGGATECPTLLNVSDGGAAQRAGLWAQEGIIAWTLRP